MTFSFNFQGENGKVELRLEGDFGDTFEIAPSIIENRAHFVISVKNNRKLDYEKIQELDFEVRVQRGDGEKTS